MMAPLAAPTLEKKVKIVKRVMFWTTFINVITFLFVLLGGYYILSH